MHNRPTVQDSSVPIMHLTAGDIIRRRRSFDPVNVFHTPSEPPVRYTVSEARFRKVHYARDFGRVEAMVEVTYMRHPSEPPRTVCLRASVSLGGSGQRRDLRQRLIQSAVNLSVLFDRLNRGDITLRAA
ncbi:hypothetical protein DSM110093_02110 [Sulfitobacter sp. DSM 110093]|uniref:hypothetical protein n=1 Tax=Sulfitobacter sp. DSM 110093 TaxID=2883127 RepID=UPI001FAB4626|nr:hypothetical protein [Sulfitobacter sp. DSM 110093]UOA32320.1 hypothetical protein DSM110093_02110 [Sulfitobacter sp. DSM 110093]